MRIISPSETETHTGTIINVNLDRGFGFISISGCKDVFFHCSALGDDLSFDEQLRHRRVEFKVVQASRGLQASEIRPAT